MAQRWSRFELLTLAGVPAGWLDGVDACSLSWSLYSSTHRTGTLTVSGAGVDWGRYLLRPWRYERAHGATTAQPRGVYLMTSPGRELLDGRQRHDVTLYGLEASLSRVPLFGPLDIAAGQAFTTVMLARLAALGISGGRVAATASAKTLAAPVHFDAGKSELEVWNHLAESLGYWGLSFSNSGQALVRPYVRPADRPEAYRFAPAADKIVPGVKEASDGWKVPNVLVGTSRLDDGSTISYSAQNLDDGPYSYAARGYWVGDDGGPVQLDCPDAATLAAATTERLRLASAGARRTWDVEVAPLPWEGGEVGRLDIEGVSALTAVRSWTEDMVDLAADMRVTLEEVAG